jgi:hypothetical protein
VILPARRRRHEVVECGLLVAELGTVAGLAVWRGLCEVRRWGVGEPPGGARPPRPDGRVPEALWAPLAVLTCLAEGRGADDEARLFHACRRIARWAEGESAWRTALAWEGEIAAAWPGARSVR